MALKINFPDRTGGTCENAYIIARPKSDNYNKNGELELIIFKSQEARELNKNPINYYLIPLSGYEIVRDDGTIQQLSYIDIAWKTGTEVYAKIKTLKLLVDSEIIDLSETEDI